MGILDLLPEEPIPLMRTEGMKSLQKKNFGMVEHRCSRCGARFFLPWGAKGYARSYRGKELRFCTWHCLREDEKEREKPKRGRKCALAQERIEELRRKNKEDEEMLERADALGMTRQEIKNVKNRMGARTRKMMELEGK